MQAPKGNLEPERICPIITWESFALRAERRIKRNMEKVLRLCYQGTDLMRLSKIPGTPGLRTMRRWCSENLYGFGREYHQFMRELAIQRLHASVEADLKVITAKAVRKSRTPDRTS